jgi:hypothetical protein
VLVAVVDLEEGMAVAPEEMAAEVEAAVCMFKDFLKPLVLEQP